MSEQKHLNLKTADLMPTTDALRTITFLDFTLIWAGMSIDMSSFSVGAQLYPGIDPWGIIWATIVGYTMVVAILTLTGDIGIMYGVPFAVYARACFGYVGTHLPAIIRGIPCWFWFGFQTWLAGYAVNTIIQMMFGYSNVMLFTLIFAVAQVANAAFGIKAMAKFDWLAIPILTVVFSVVLVWLMVSHDATPAMILAAPANNTVPFAVAAISIAGGYITMGINFMDITKNLKRDSNYQEQSFLKRNRHVIIGSCIGLTAVGLLFLMMGTVAQILTGTWNPIDIMAAAFESQPLVLIMCIIAIVFASWSTNTAANLLPGAYILSNLLPKRINFAWGVVISGIIALIMVPWKFGDFLVPFQLFCSGMLGPIAGIIISDYYLVRKGKVNVQALYESGGQYAYYKNINPAGIISLLVAFAFALLSFDYSFFIGFFISIVLYYVLMKYWIIKKYPQAELDESFVPTPYDPSK